MPEALVIALNGEATVEKPALILQVNRVPNGPCVAVVGLTFHDGRGGGGGGSSMFDDGPYVEHAVHDGVRWAFGLVPADCVTVSLGTVQTDVIRHDILNFGAFVIGLDDDCNEPINLRFDDERYPAVTLSDWTDF